MTISLQALRDRRDQLAASLASVDDLRPGFLTARFRKCASPTATAPRKTPGDMVRPIRSLIGWVERPSTQVIPAGPAVEQAKRTLPNTDRSGTWCGN